MNVTTQSARMPFMSPLEILDGDDSRADEVDTNKPIEVDTPRLKEVIEDLHTLKKKLRTLPSSPRLNWLRCQLKREQIIENKHYQIIHFGIEERNLELPEQESTIKMEKLRPESAREHLNVE